MSDSRGPASCQGTDLAGEAPEADAGDGGDGGAGQPVRQNVHRQLERQDGLRNLRRLTACAM